MTKKRNSPLLPAVMICTCQSPWSFPSSIFRTGVTAGTYIRGRSNELLRNKMRIINEVGIYVDLTNKGLALH
jgi:hypothetical protein